MQVLLFFSKKRLRYVYASGPGLAAMIVPMANDRDMLEISGRPERQCPFILLTR